MIRKPVVALVGRPNVGKSTLFNRLVGERLAIVEDRPGTTRDRLYADVMWGTRVFVLADTGGLVLGEAQRGDDEEERSAHTLVAQVRAQAQMAMEEADAIILLADITDGVTPADEEIAALLRRTSKPIMLVVNKADNLKRELNLPEFYGLGLGEPYPVSALHGLGTGELLDAVVERLPPLPPEEEETTAGLRIALVGRTNVGKSSLLNRILGEERVIVSEMPGTTRDAIDTTIRYHGEEIVLVDTAGIRRRGSIQPGVEKYSVLRALRAVQRADVVLLLLDATAGVTAQDTHVAGYVLEEHKSITVLVNKWDLIEKDAQTLPQYEQHVRRELNFLDYVPVLFVSALTGQRVERILPLALRMREERRQRLSTVQINDLIHEAIARHAPPSKWGRALRIYYGTQVGQDPPTFIFFVNDEELVHFSYQRYLENKIRERYRFEGTPIKLIFRGHEEER